MAGRRTNLALLALLAAALTTGGVAYALGSGWGRWVTAGHAVTGLATMVLAPWKGMIARRGVRRHGAGAWPSLALGVLVVVTVVAGLLHSTGVALSWGPVTAMQAHVGAALIALPFAVWHVVARPVRPRRADLSRRNMLRAAGVAGAGMALYGGAEGTTRLLSLPGADRRFTGSHERGSGRPADMPVTQWLDDSVPRAGEEWRLAVQAAGRQRLWTRHQLDEAGDEVDAVLDCTGGWYARQRWAGARLDRLVDAGDGRSVVVRSVTGYQRRFPMGDVPNLLVATRVGGQPLSAGHGHPARLVAPGRRGFWWVKWIETITVDDTPWWWQPPFPLT